jgi:hypothetical protein
MKVLQTMRFGFASSLAILAIFAGPTAGAQSDAHRAYPVAPEGFDVRAEGAAQGRV